MNRPSLVGREADVRDLVELVGTNALTTIVGTGGVGKTRLAIEVVERVRENFGDGVFFVDLAGVRRTDFHETTVAAALGHRSLGAVVDGFNESTALVILDNCEHVVDGVAAVVDDLLRCPGLRVLATSRTPLEVSGEFVRPLRPLPVDDGCDLLRQRAVAAGADAALQPEALETLVRRVDAIPLGIELAATRLRSLEPSEVVAALDGSLEGIRVRRRGADPSARHESLSRAIEWSYDLLDEDESAALRRLSLVPGGFELARAHAVLGSRDRMVTADLLDRLVSQSMVSTTRRDGRLVYRLLETIRQYAFARLEESGEQSETRRRYIDHVAATSADLIARAVEQWSAEVVDDTLRMAADLLVAPRFSMEAGDDGEVALVMFLPSWGLVHEHHAGQVATLGRELVEHYPSTAGGWADVAAITATAMMRLSRKDEAVQVARAALAAEGIVNEPVARRVIAMADQHDGRFADALAHVRLARTKAAELSLVPFEAELLVFEATLLSQLGRLDEAVDVAAEAQRRNRTIGSVPVATWSLVLEAYLSADRDPARSRRLVELAEGETDPERAQWIVARHLGLLAVKAGDSTAGVRWLRRALDAARQAGEGPHTWVTLRWIAVLAATRGTEPLDGSLDLLDVVERSPSTPAPGALDLELLQRARSLARERSHRVALDDNDPDAPFDLAHRLLDRLEPLADVSADGPDHLREAPARGPSAVFVRRGEVWTVGWIDGAVSERTELAHTKGLADLAWLLANPDAEVHSLELMGALVEESSIDTGLDASARKQLEARLREVQADLESAEADNDLGQVARGQAEFDRIVDALSAGLGLGGRSRSAGGSAEKARSAVRWRIRAAITKLETDVPHLARHLQASVKTGIWCSYRPEVAVQWELS